MSSTRQKKRFLEFFTKPPQLRSAFYITTRYLAGVHISSKDKQVNRYFILPLEESVVEPSFTRKNIIDKPALEERLKEGMDKLHLSEKKTACLIPELSLKAFVFSFESLPSSPDEKEKIIRFRIKRQMGFFPEDARLSYQDIRSNQEKKLLVSLAKDSVIQEYEASLGRLGLRVRLLGSPVLGLYNILNNPEENNVLLINVERESLGLIAVIDREISLYRQKPFALETQAELSTDQQADNIITEVDNTAHFLEDTEKKSIDSLYIRIGALSGADKIYAQLEDRLSYNLKRMDVARLQSLNAKEREVLSPLIGQIL